MCGITGWYSPRQDLTGERAVLARMTSVLARRGPDASGLYLRPRVGLGHQRLAIIDIEGGTQPMVADAAGAEVALTYSGEVYNFTELRRELAALGHPMRTRSDTEVVLRAYLAWGADFATRLNGMFALAIWDGRTEELLLVRDRLGVKPLYYQRIGDGVLFGSEPKAILAHPAVPGAADLGGLREAFSWIRNPGRTLWKDMAEVRPGTMVVAGRNGLRETAYWRLAAEPHRSDLPATITEVKGLIEDIVRRQLVTDVPRCTLLSGGLDSSLITAYAQRELGDRERIRSFCVDFGSAAGGFRADRFRDAPDAPFAAQVAEHSGTDHRAVLLDAAAVAHPDVRRAVVTAKDLPTGFGDADNSLYLLFAEIRKTSTVALSGESADEVFGGYKWMHQPEAQRAGGFPWVDHTHVTSPWTGLDIFDEGFRRDLDLPCYIAQSYRDAAAATPRLPGETGLDATMRLVSYLHLTRYLAILLDRKDRLSMASGLEVRVPFCDHRLVEYMFNTPWSMKVFDGAEKSLLRAAAAGLVPEAVLARRKAPYPATQDPAYSAEILRQAERLLADANHPVMDLTDRAWLKEAVNAGSEALAPSAKVGVERWLDLAGWLEIYRPSLDLKR